MSKWRPVDNCLYVIPDIHGMYNQLSLMLSRILPLRKTGGHRDTLVFLGDYIDRRADSHKVVDLIMEVKEDAQDQVVTILGNHELMLLEAIKPNATLEHYNMWMHNGGDSTLGGYLKRDNSDINDPYLVPRHNIDRWIPKEHIKFFNNLIPYYENDNYIFVHGGCDPFVPLSSQSSRVLAWDRSVYHQMYNMAKKGMVCPWEKTIVTGHNGEKDGRPFIYDKFMMLDGSYVDKLVVWELNSRTGFSARKNKKRLVKELIP
jgi:serine/threonine protein phosphatase 1